MTLDLTDLDEITRIVLLRPASPAEEAAQGAYVGTVMEAALTRTDSRRADGRWGLVSGLVDGRGTREPGAGVTAHRCWRRAL